MVFAIFQNYLQLWKLVVIVISGYAWGQIIVYTTHMHYTDEQLHESTDEFNTSNIHKVHVIYAAHAALKFQAIRSTPMVIILLFCTGRDEMQ